MVMRVSRNTDDVCSAGTILLGRANVQMVLDGKDQANQSFFHCDNAMLVSSRQMDEELWEQEHYRRGDETEERDVAPSAAWSIALRYKKAPRPGAYPQGFSSFVMTSPQRPQTLSARSSASPIHLKRKEIVDDLKALRCSAATSLAACNLRSKVLVPTAARDDHVTDSSSTSSPYLASRGPPSDGSSDPFSLGSDLGGVISYTISSPSFPQPLLAPVASSLADLGIDATLCSTAACILSSLSVSPITLDGGHAHDSEDLEGEEKRTAEARDGWKTRRRSGLGRREIRIPKRFREEGDYSRCFKRRRHE